MHTIVAAHTPPTVCCSRVGGRAYDEHGNNVWGLAPFLGESICDWHSFPTVASPPSPAQAPAGVSNWPLYFEGLWLLRLEAMQHAVLSGTSRR